jgi:hypothetical protein
VCISTFLIHIGSGPIQRPVGLTPKSDNSLPASESVGAKTVRYSAICPRGLTPYINRANFTVLLLHLLELGLHSQYIETDFLMFVPYSFTNIFKAKTFYFENVLIEIVKLIRIFIGNEKI